MVDTGQLRYVLGLASVGLIALGGILKITDVEFWGAAGVIIAMVVADQVKHRND